MGRFFSFVTLLDHYCELNMYSSKNALLFYRESVDILGTLWYIDGSPHRGKQSMQKEWYLL